MKGAIDFGSRRIEYTIAYSPRKSLGITVTPDNEVLIKAPDNTSQEKIEKVIRKKAPWILKQQTYFLSFQPRTPARRFVSGETHLYMGRQYILKVIKAKKNGVHFTGRQIIIYSKRKSSPEILLNQWYRERAKMKFAEIAEPLIKEFKKYKAEPECIYLQHMTTRWGSCTPKGKIILNPELIKASKGCIEYVIIHELCHLVHKNHTAKFFDLQKKQMSDWEKWKMKLETLLA